ncbi:4Fe-4S binding protein [Megamonas funiformis]
MKKVNIDYQKCIRCYCCQELCPHQAVDLKDGLILSLLKYIGIYK